KIYQCLDLDETLNWLQQIAGALLYLHDNQISQMDIKSDNILLSPISSMATN
ncbi:unnamed protein product, partial [Oppiella nova]